MNDATPESLAVLHDDAQASRFVQVTPAMLRIFDQDAVVAILYAFFRFATMRGQRWVEFTSEQISEETGLTIRQVTRARGVLVGGGYVNSRRKDKWNPTCEFRLAGSGDDPEGTSRDYVRASTHETPGGVSLPYSKEVEQEENQEPASAGGELVLLSFPNNPLSQPAALVPNMGTAPVRGDGFDEFWEHALRKVDKKTSRVAYGRAIKKVSTDVLLAAWVAYNQHYRTGPVDEQRYCRHPATWLNKESWDNPPPARSSARVNASDFAALAERMEGRGESGDTFSGTIIAGTVVSDTSGWG